MTARFSLIVIVSSLLLMSCVSPRYLYPQRSALKIEESGPLLFSTAPNLGSFEVTNIGEQLEITDSILIKNSGEQKLAFSDGFSDVLYNDAILQPICLFNGSEVKEFVIEPKANGILLCKVKIRKMASVANDSVLYFRYSLKKTKVFESQKIIRKADFYE